MLGILLDESGTKKTVIVLRNFDIFYLCYKMSTSKMRLFSLVITPHYSEGNMKQDRNVNFLNGCLPFFLIIFLVGWFQGCASSPSLTRDSGFDEYDYSHPYVPTKEVAFHAQPFEGTLPLGIGARFDFLVSNAASEVSDFYSSYIEPYRKGKIFNRQPYQLDYSILPRRGEAFQKKNSIFDSVSFKSDYKLQIGVSRNFISLSDFLKPGFWLGTGRYSTSTTRPNLAEKWENPLLHSSSEENLDLDLNQTPGLDIDSILDERYNLVPDSSTRSSSPLDPGSNRGVN